MDALFSWVVFSVSLSIPVWGNAVWWMFFLLHFTNLLKLVQNNKSLEQENESLKEYSYLLKNDTHYIEKIAREELGLLKSGEVVYFFEND